MCCRKLDGCDELSAIEVRRTADFPSNPGNARTDHGPRACATDLRRASGAHVPGRARLTRAANDRPGLRLRLEPLSTNAVRP
jgi:hypothetical protein